MLEHRLNTLEALEKLPIGAQLEPVRKDTLAEPRDLGGMAPRFGGRPGHLHKPAGDLLDRAKLLVPVAARPEHEIHPPADGRGLERGGQALGFEAPEKARGVTRQDVPRLPGQLKPALVTVEGLNVAGN